MQNIQESVIWAFKVNFFWFIPILIFALFSGNFHHGPGGPIALFSNYVLAPFHFFAEIFQHSNSLIFWVCSIVLEFVTTFFAFFLFRIIYILIKAEL